MKKMQVRAIQKRLMHVLCDVIDAPTNAASPVFLSWRPDAPQDVPT